jgi:hypothetical protein
MRQILSLLLITVFLISCSTAKKVTQQDIQTSAETLDYGDLTSQTLTTKAWDALDDKNYPAVFAYTQKCVELYGDEGKQMNDGLEYFASPEDAAQLWALNDVGTSLYIMATAYEELEMYPQAREAYKKLANDYAFAQTWDPKGWYWKPATGAASKAEQLKYKE